MLFNDIQAAGSDHILFRRVRETPTAIYYEPNEDGDTDNAAEKGEDNEIKHIVLENVSKTHAKHSQLEQIQNIFLIISLVK